MANSVITTILRDGQRNVVLDTTGVLDTSNYAQTDITNIGILNPVPNALRIDHIQYSIQDGLSLQLWWEDTSLTSLILPLAGRGKLDGNWFGGYSNPKRAGYTGNIMLSTNGWTAGTYYFNLVMELVKQ